jgi:hypothetical protein
MPTTSLDALLCKTHCCVRSAERAHLLFGVRHQQSQLPSDLI